MDYNKLMEDMRLKKSKDLTEIESKKANDIIGALGKDTLIAMANAGVENQAKMLEGLGLKGYLMTDGKTPVNLFSAAGGLLGNMGSH